MAFVVKKIRTSDFGKSKGGASTAVPADGHRERILKAAMELLTKGGRDALTTRAVAKAARVQPPVLYRLFNDKAGLLNAVAEHGFSVYTREKRSPESADDPVEALRAGWRLHVEFGLSHPELYLLMYADPHPEIGNAGAECAHRMLQDHLWHVAAAGRLRFSVERAAHLFHAAACGIVMTLLGMPGEERDMCLSDTACDAALAAIVTDRPMLPTPTIAAAATTLRALVTGAGGATSSEPNVFSEPEQALLIEWLDRLGKLDSSSNGRLPGRKESPRMLDIEAVVDFSARAGKGSSG